MDFLRFNINSNYLDDAYSMLKIPEFPDIDRIGGEIFKAIGTNEKDSKRLFESFQWALLLQKKYVEFCTSLIYTWAYHQKNINEGLYGKDPTDPFYEPHISYFIDNAADQAFSLAEKLAQLVNVYKKLNLAEAYTKGKDYVNLKNVVKKLDNEDEFKVILSTMKSSLDAFEQIRHGHTHRFDPEMTRWEVNKVSPGIKNEKDPVNVIMYGINEKALPEPPIKQFEKCLDVLITFNKALKDIFLAIEKGL